MFGYARDHEPCMYPFCARLSHVKNLTNIFFFFTHAPTGVIFMDEIDAIGEKASEGSSTDREIQRTLMELLNQLDGLKRWGR